MLEGELTVPVGPAIVLFAHGGGVDCRVIRMNAEAYTKLRCEKELKIVSRATDLFEEPGTLEEVARPGANWFQRHLVADKAV